jgi:hypothetical protein
MLVSGVLLKLTAAWVPVVQVPSATTDTVLLKTPSPSSPSAA